MKWGQCGVVRDGGYHEGHPDPYFSNWRSQWKFYFWKMWRPKLHLKNGFSGGKQLCQPTYFTSWNGRSTESLVSWLWEVFWPCLSRYPQKQRKRSLQSSVAACVCVKLFKTSAQKAIISFSIKRVVLELPCCCSSMISTLGGVGRLRGRKLHTGQQEQNSKWSLQPGEWELKWRRGKCRSLHIGKLGQLHK